MKRVLMIIVGLSLCAIAFRGQITAQSATTILNTATAVGQTTMENQVYRWTAVYVKNKTGWRIAASQASKKE